jgi:amino acid transporter
VFILLTYGGWNEAAYLSGELRDVNLNMVRVLLLGTGTVVLLYLAINVALVMSAGLAELRQEKLVTEPIEKLFGPLGAAVAAAAICFAALSTLNGTIFTGARSIFALGETFQPLHGSSTRNARGVPAIAILLQCAISLCLVGFGATTRDGFTAMVEYTAPVFWGFMVLIGLALIVFRLREPEREIPYRVPFYPVTPLLFCGTSLYLAYASVVYTGAGALIGLAILASGIPFYLMGYVREPLPTAAQRGTR